MNNENIKQILEKVDSIIGYGALIAVGMKMQADICQARHDIEIMLNKLMKLEEDK